MSDVERERLDVDILFVGAGAATLSCAIRLAQLCREQNVEMPAILVIEKGPEVGAHQLSGAMMDPLALSELIPDFEEQGFPYHYRCTKDAVWVLTKTGRSYTFPITPPPFANHGNYAISLSDFVKWLSTLAEELEIEIYPQASTALLANARRTSFHCLRNRIINAPNGTAQTTRCASISVGLTASRDLK